jgi:diadenosine tetraphosphate (Ap4A) HIT family hydrolase
VSLDRIWAGWRSVYVAEIVDEQPRGAEECVLCRLADESDPEGLIVRRGERAFVVMNAYPYTSGHVMVAPIRHEANLDGLDSEESRELMTLTQQTTTALAAAYSPDGINVGVNLGRAAGAGVPGHVHVHVLARWSADTNFLTTVAEARVLNEDLRTSWQKVMEAWPDG